MIPSPKVVAYGYINGSVKRGKHWFFNVNIKVGKESQTLNLLVVDNASSVADACIEFENKSAFDVFQNTLMKFTYEYRHGYDGVMVAFEKANLPNK